jgi:drug/metabolite transporter (DMT)-like permease
MTSELLAVVYGVSSALSWGSGDFSGGYASRHTNVYTVILLSQFTGLVVLLALAWGFREPLPTATNWVFAAIAGIAGASGLVALYTGLASGRMGIVAPMSAVIAAILPVCVGVATEGVPGTSTLAGFGLAVPAVWLLTQTHAHEKIHVREVYLSLLAGGGFGLFFILMGQLHDSSVMWPLVAARIASLSILFGIACLRDQGGMPSASQLPVILLAGVLDAGGNAFFVLATQIGRLDISAVLSSLYPAATVLLARCILKEQLRPQQWAGVSIALVALLLIAS